MKKVYKKPWVVLERFEISQRLSSCSLSIGFNDVACVLNDDDSTFMMKDLALRGFFNGDACLKHPDGMEIDDGICYHISVNQAFSS